MARQWIRKIAEELLQSANVVRPPVPIERVAQLQGAEIRRVPYEGKVSGVLFRDNGRTVIGVNSRHGENRQRFTIAHELGHLTLHAGGRIFVDRDFTVRRRDDLSSQATDPDEIEANAFAAEILMPATMLERDVDKTAVDYESDDAIEDLAKRYQVSVQAMTIRLSTLGLIPQAAEP